MQLSGDNFELNLLIKATDQYSKVLKDLSTNVKQTTKVTDDLGKVAKQTGKEGANKFQSLNNEVRNMLMPLRGVQRSLMLVRWASLAAFGGIAATIISVTKKINDMEDEAIKLGMTFEKYSELTLGEKIETKNVKKLAERFDILGKKIEVAKLKFAEFLASGINKEFEREAEKPGSSFSMTGAKAGLMSGLTASIPGVSPALIQFITKTKLGTSEEQRKKMGQMFDDGLAAVKKLPIIGKSVDLISNSYNKMTNAVSSTTKAIVDNAAAAEAKAKATYLSSLKEEETIDTLEKIRLKYYKGNEAIQQLESNRRREQLVKDLKLNSEQMKTFKDVYNYRLTLLNDALRIEEDGRQRAKWGFKTWADEVSDSIKQTGQAISKTLSDVFIDGLDNKFKNARQLFVSFLTDIRNMIVKSMINQMLASIVSAVGGGSSTGFNWGGLVAGIAGSAAGGMFSGGGAATGTTNTGYWNNVSLPGFATGGIVTKPTRALIGEAGPEAVIPLDKLKSGGETTYIYINAIDSASFVDMLNRNPDAVTTIVQKNIQSNKYLRHTMKAGK